VAFLVLAVKRNKTLPLDFVSTAAYNTGWLYEQEQGAALG
jgi:hypothetical protein